jgi:hypothetical protein
MHGDEVVTGMVQSAERLLRERGSSIPCFAAREGQTVEV